MNKHKVLYTTLMAHDGMSSIVIVIIIVIFAFFLSSVFFADIPTDNPVIAMWQRTPPGTTHTSLQIQTMRFITATPTPTPLPNTSGTISTSPFSSGAHGAFNIYTPAEVVQAHNAGVTYDIIDYWGNWGSGALAWDLDVNSALGKALQQYNMKGYLMLSDLLHRNPNISGAMMLDTVAFTNRVKQYVNSPLLGGYWIKDDDPQFCNDGNYSAPLTSELQTEYKIIRQIDTNTSHVIMAGFCDSADLSKNYHPTVGAPIADAAGMYPYPNLYKGWTFFTDETTEVQKEASIIKQNTPPGLPMPAMVGIYAGFWGDNCVAGIYHCNGGVAPISQTELITDIDAFMNNGFAGVADFSFEATDVNHTAGNDKGMLQYVQDVTNELKKLGKY